MNLSRITLHGVVADFAEAPAMRTDLGAMKRPVLYRGLIDL